MLNGTLLILLLCNYNNHCSYNTGTCEKAETGTNTCGI